jgi:PAS domain S-box-containing protein
MPAKDDPPPSQEQLSQEVTVPRCRLAELEATEAARRQAEEALRKSEERFRTFASHTYDWECWHDADGILLYSSPSCHRMTGYHAEDFYSDLYGTLNKLYYPEDREILESHIHNALSGANALQLDHRIITRDGEVRWIEHICQAVYDSQGRYAGRRSCNRDITEKKHAEELLQKTHRDMEERILERTAELTRTVEKLHREIEDRIRAEKELQQERRTLQHLLRSSDRERQLIAYEIHDGLAQYLAGAIMQFQAFVSLKVEQPDRAEESFAAGMDMLHQGHSEARHLISGLRPPILDESGIVAAITHLVQEPRSPEGTNLEFSSRVSFDRLDPVMENGVYRIIQECLANACKHSGSKNVRIEMTQEDHCLRIQIQDWGKGFPWDAVREGCFGLEGVKERARLLGGKVSIESVLEEGTRIVVELPMH